MLIPERSKPIRWDRRYVVKDTPHTALRFWLMIWVLALPLVHIHPEVDHAYGMSGHVHGGTYHSILVNTPVHAHQGYDQEEHHHDGFFAPKNHRGSQQDPLHPFHGFEEATYSFSVLKSTIHPDSGKSGIPYGLVISIVNFPYYSADCSKPPDYLESQCFSTFPLTLAPRAPPILFM